MQGSEKAMSTMVTEPFDKLRVTLAEVRAIRRRYSLIFLAQNRWRSH